jgi:DNA-binding LacI/PurR family transcriptional regulator
MSLPLTEQHLRTLKAGGLPVVMLDAESPGPPRIVIDNEAGGRMATEYLLDLGHRRIAFVGDESYPDLAFTSTAHRLLGYRGALADAGIATDPHLIRLIPHGGFVLASSAMRSATELIETAEPPTAIFASSDTQAIGVVHAVEHRGLRVPDDISVIGFDDIDSAALVRLSTVRQPLHESGALAARRLCALLSGKRVGRRRTVLPLVLVRRSSTSPPRRRDGEGPRRHPAKGAADNGSSRSRPAIRARGPTGGSAPPARSIAWPEPA